MAGENLGSVYYTVDADTTAMLQAEAQINKSLEGVVKDFKVADKAVTDFMKTQASLGRTINSHGQVFSKSGKIIVSASNDYRALAAAANSAKAAAVGMNKGFTKTADGVKKGMNGMKGAAQNFGYQIQDISVQLSGGQNPILILSQQLPQMLVGMGAAAAGIGALIAVMGGLFLAFGNSTNKLESFQKAIESMQASITIGATGVAEYTSQMKVLAGLSETLAKIKIAALIGEQRQAYKDGAASLADYTSNVAGFVRGFGSLESTVSGLTGKKLGSDGYDEAAASMKEFRFAVGAFNASQTVESVDMLEAATKRFSDAGASSTKQGRELSARVVELITAFRSGELSLKALNDALKDNSLITGDAAAKAKQYADTVNQMVASLKLETETLGTSDRAKALHVAWMNKATQAQFDEINTAYDAIEAHTNNEASVKRLASEEQTLADQRKRNADAYNKQMFDQFIAEEKQAQAERDRKKARGETVTAGVTSLAASPLDKLQTELQAKYDLIAEYELLETSNHQLAVDARAAADTLYLEKVKQLNADQSTSFADAMAANGASMASFQASAIGAFASVATGAQSGQEAVRSLAQSILTQMIGALIQMGISALIGQSTATAGAVASAGVIATAMAPAAALTSLATAGGNSVPAGVGIASVAGIAEGVALSGARLYGGYTAPNSMYKVNENGQAEMFSDGKNDFLMTGGSGGKVTSASDLGGSQPVINITTVNNASGTDVQVQQSTSNGQTDIKFIIDTVAGNIASGGKVRTAITRSTSAKNKVV
jgi:hypothetical protein